MADAISKVVRRSRVPAVLACAVGFSGLVNVWEGIFAKDPAVLDWMEEFLPFDISQHSRMLLVSGGLFLLLLSRGLYRRKHAAFLLTLGLLIISPLLHLSSAFDWHHAVVQLLVAAALFHWRGEFRALSDESSVRWAIVISVAMLVVLTVFGLASFHAYAAQISGQRGFWRELQCTLELIFLQGTDTLTPDGTQAAVVFRTISEAGILFGLTALVLFLRPVLPHRTRHWRDDGKARGLIADNGCDPLDEFALLPDKRHFFSTGGVLISYALWRDVAVTLGDPVGPSAKVRAAIGEFIAFCARQDWQPVFYQIRTDYLKDYRAAGFRLFKIAEDSRISLAEFALAGRKFQGLRTAHNKLAKQGWTVQWTAGKSLPPDTLRMLAEISSAWLAARGAIEMTFDLGSLARESLEPADIAILRDGSGRALAFATWLPYAQGKGRALDMMRHRPTDRNVIDSLVVACLLEYRSRGLEEVSLGNAPLANLEQREIDSLEEKAARLLYERFDQYYGYRSLFEFKNKFHPRWTGRYLAYRGVPNLLPAVAAIVRVHLPAGLAKFLRS